jgi:hypothetical protein
MADRIVPSKVSTGGLDSPSVGIPIVRPVGMYVVGFLAGGQRDALGQSEVALAVAATGIARHARKLALTAQPCA